MLCVVTHSKMSSGTPPKDDLQTAIELSLQESQSEEIELNRYSSGIVVQYLAIAP